MLQRYKTTTIGRRVQSVSFHYYDVDVHEDGVGFYFMWRTNTIRIPLLATINDGMKRMARKNSAPEGLSFFLKWEDFLGVVIHDIHREVMVRSPTEVFKLLFRKKKYYDEFKGYLDQYCKDRTFSRDNSEIPESIFEGAADMGIPIHTR